MISSRKVQSRSFSPRRRYEERGRGGGEGGEIIHELGDARSVRCARQLLKGGTSHHSKPLVSVLRVSWCYCAVSESKDKKGGRQDTAKKNMPHRKDRKEESGEKNTFLQGSPFRECFSSNAQYQILTW